MGIDTTGLADGHSRVTLPDGSTVDVKTVHFEHALIYKVVVDDQMMSPELAATYMQTQRNYWRGAAEHHIKEADKYRTAYADAMQKLRTHGLANDIEAVPLPEDPGDSLEDMLDISEPEEEKPK